MSEKLKINQLAENVPTMTSLEKDIDNSHQYDYKSLAFFLERTAESIHRTTVMIQQLESEVARLKYEVIATENEYKNLRYVASDLEQKKSKSSYL